MNNISFNDFLDGFDLPAFTSAGGDWELLKSILKNAATTTNTSSSSTLTNTNKSEVNTNKDKINSTINTNKSETELKKKPSYNNNNNNTAPSTLSSSSDENKTTTKQGEPLYTVTISDKDGEITFSDENGTKTYKHPMNNSTEGEKETRSIGHCKVMSNLNILKPDSNPTSFEVSSNMGIRTFLYGMRERLPNTVKLINNIMGNEESYYDFIYKELSDEFLNDLIEGIDKEMEKYNSLVTYFKDQK